MPARGSGIGASMGQSPFGGTGGATGRPASPTTGAIYPGQGSVGSRRQSGGWFQGPTGMLLLLVFLEMAALVAIRHGFRHHHGG